MSRCLALGVLVVCLVYGGRAHGQESFAGDPPAWRSLQLDAQTLSDPDMLMALARLDTSLRKHFEIEAEQTAVGLMDMNSGRVAMLRPDTMYYAASVPKITILLAYFQTHPKAADGLDEVTRRELGRMIKRSDNALAAKYSQLIGLKTIADVLTSPAYSLYDPAHGGGLWMGKHYSKADERYGDPLADVSHAATVRQLLRYYLMLEQGRLVSPRASKTMREIFESPDIEHGQSKFVLGLTGRDVKIIRKSGTWRDWHADSAVVTGEGGHYILAALTHHEKGGEYLIHLARNISDWAGVGFQGEAVLSHTLIGQPAAATQPEAD